MIVCTCMVCNYGITHALWTTITAHIATDHQFRSILFPLLDFDMDDELRDDINRMINNGH